MQTHSNHQGAEKGSIGDSGMRPRNPFSIHLTMSQRMEASLQTQSDTHRRNSVPVLEPRRHCREG
jgi:hypothetical protein